jgi:hypothetical protein
LTVADETFDAGVEFDGKINKLTFNLGPLQRSPADQKAAKERIATAND